MAIKVEVETAPESGSWNDYTSLARFDTLRVVSQGAADAGTAQCTFRDSAGTATILPECGMRVTDGTLVMFRGKIKKRGKTERMVAPSQRKKEYAVTAQDATCLLVDDVIDTGGLRSAAETDAARMIWLVTTYGTKGVTAAATGSGGFVQTVYGSTLPEQDFTGLNLYEALQEVAKFSGGKINVDNNLALHHFLTETNAAPFNLSDSPNNVTTFGYRGFDFPDDSLDLVNAVYVIGAGGVGEWVTDATSISTYGRKEGAFKDATLDTSVLRQAAGNAILATRKAPRGPIKLRVFQPGLRAGMTIQITNSTWGVTAVTYRIAEVEAFVFGSAFMYDVSLQDAPITLQQYVSTKLETINRDVRRSTNAAIDYASQFLVGRVKVVAALPTLPDANYPVGMQVFLTSDEKIYRNPDDVAWTRDIDGLDIIADTITAGAIAAGAIGAEALAAEIVLGSTIIAGDPAAQHVELDLLGVRLVDAADSTIFNAPTTAAQPVFVKGDIEAGTLTTHEAATLETEISLAKSAIMTAEAGVQAPKAAPVLVASYEKKSHAADASYPIAAYGDYDPAGGAGGATKVFWGKSYGGGSHYALIEIDAVTRAVLRHVDLPAPQFPYGAARLGSYVYVNTGEGTTHRVLRYNAATLALDTTYSAVSYPAATKRVPRITSDGTNLYIVDTVQIAGPHFKVVWNKYDASMVKVGSTIDTGYNIDYNGSGDIGGVYAGNGDFGAFRMVVLGQDPHIGVVTFNSTGVNQPNESWYQNQNSGNGVMYGDAEGDGARFWVGETSTSINKMTQWTWTTASAKYWVGYTWYDQDAGGTGTHETTIGPRASITMLRRQRLSVTTATVPFGGGTDDPNRARVYMLPNATAPAVTTFKRQSEDAGTQRFLTTYNAAGAADPGSNTFPNATPAEIRSAGSEWRLLGDGTIPAFGVVQSYTPTLTGFGTATFTNNEGRYLVIGEMVWIYVNVLINAVGTGGTTLEISLPVAAHSGLTFHSVPGRLSGVTGKSGFGGALIGGGGNFSSFDRIQAPDGTNVARADLTAGARILLEGWYRKA